MPLQVKSIFVVIQILPSSNCALYHCIIDRLTFPNTLTFTRKIYLYHCIENATARTMVSNDSNNADILLAVVGVLCFLLFALLILSVWLVKHQSSEFVPLSTGKIYELRESGGLVLVGTLWMYIDNVTIVIFKANAKAPSKLSQHLESICTPC